MKGYTSHLLVNLYMRSLYVPAYLLFESILPNNPAGAKSCTESCGVKFSSCPSARLQLQWLLQPQSGEVFHSLDYYNCRLRGYSLAQGFDIIRKGGGSKSNPSWGFFCIHHGRKTQNTRRLEDKVERDNEGIITSRRQRENTNIGQLDCNWEGLCSFKDLGKRGSGSKGYILTVKCDGHNHELDNNLFQFPAHLKNSGEYIKAIRQAKKHR